MLLPVFVTALTGAAADIPLGDLAGSVALVLGVPLAIAALVRLAAARADAHDRLDRAVERAQPIGLALLAIATAAFPNRPLVVVALVVGPLVELPVLALTANRLLRRQPTTTAG